MKKYMVIRNLQILKQKLDFLYYLFMPLWVYILSGIVLVVGILIFELGSQIVEDEKHFIMMIGAFLLLYVLIVAVILVFNKKNPASNDWLNTTGNSPASQTIEINTTRP